MNWQSYLSNIAPRQTSSKGPWPFLAASLSFSYSPSAPIHPLLSMQRGPIDILRNQEPRTKSIKIALLYLPFHQVLLPFRQIVQPFLPIVLPFHPIILPFHQIFRPFHQIFQPYHQSALLYLLIHLVARSHQLFHQVTLP